MGNLSAIMASPATIVDVTGDQCHMRFTEVKYNSDHKQFKSYENQSALYGSPPIVEKFAKAYGVPAVLAHSDDLPQQPVLPRGGLADYGTNGFVNAIAYAFYEHIPLVIRPDDVWIEILTQLAYYIEIHSEQLRDKFVTHQDRKELIVSDNRWTAVKDIANDQRLTDFLALICQLIQGNIKDPQLKDWYTTSFSTSTPTDQVVKNLLLMASLKKYFSYGFTFACGFPEITLRGTRDDWVKLREEVGYLKTLGVADLTTWFEVLSYTLGHFVDAYDNKVNVDFWQSAVLQHGGYSSYDNSTIHGWLLAFAPFDKKGKLWLNPLDVITTTHKYTDRRVTHTALVSSVRTVNITFTGADEIAHQLEFTAGLYDEMVKKDHPAKGDPSTKGWACHIRPAWLLRYAEPEKTV